MNSINTHDIWLVHVEEMAKDLKLHLVEIGKNDAGVFWDLPNDDKCDFTIYINLYEQNVIQLFSRDLLAYKDPDRLLVIDWISHTMLVNSLKFYEFIDLIRPLFAADWKIRWIERQDHIVPETVKIFRNHLPKEG